MCAFSLQAQSAAHVASMLLRLVHFFLTITIILGANSFIVNIDKTFLSFTILLNVFLHHFFVRLHKALRSQTELFLF